MRKLTRDQKEIMTLDNVIASCSCNVRCVDDSWMMDEYGRIQMNTAHAGDPSPWSIETDI